MGYIIYAENRTFFSSADISDVAFSHAQMAGIFFIISRCFKNLNRYLSFDRSEFDRLEVDDFESFVLTNTS